MIHHDVRASNFDGCDERGMLDSTSLRRHDLALSRR
jgi:hypothetical protein